VSARRDWRTFLVWGIFPVVYYLSSGSWSAVFIRYMVPVIPFFCLGAGVAAVWTRERLRPWVPVRLLHGVLAAILAVVLFDSARNVVLFGKFAVRKDTRVMAAEWFEREAPEASSFYQADYWGRVVLLPPLQDVKAELEHKRASGELFGRKKAELMIHYLEETGRKGYAGWSYDDREKAFYYEDRRQLGLPQYIVVQRWPVWFVRKNETDFSDLIKSSYRFKVAFQGIDLGAQGNWYDLQDAFFMPFTGFQGFLRPGPNIVVYEKIPSGGV
jgi:hypothetical protein